MSARRARFLRPAIDVRTILWKQRRYATILGQLMIPVALAGYVLAFWRLGADLRWVDEFFIQQGLLSRWQVWLVLAIVTQAVANQLSRFGSPDDGVAS